MKGTSISVKRFAMRPGTGSWLWSEPGMFRAFCIPGTRKWIWQRWSSFLPRAS